MGSWPKDSPWRQGHVLTRATAQKLGLRHPRANEGEDDSVVVVISHDCDIAQAPDREPTVEAIVGLEIEKPSGNFTYGKGPRTLHIWFTEGEHEILVELDARQKLEISKDELADCEPTEAAKLSANGLNVLQVWLAARYRRAAFPNSFVQRFEKLGVERQFKKIIESAGTHLLAVYFDVDEGESIERAEMDDCYALAIYLVYGSERGGAIARAAAEAARDAITTLFQEKCTKNGTPMGIDLRDCEAFSDDEFTLRAHIHTKRWNTDYLSLGTDPPTDTPG